MKKLLLISTLMIPILFLVGCGSGMDDENKGQQASPVNIKFASTVKSDDQAVLEADFNFLRTISISKDNSSAVKSVMGIPDTSPQSFVNWLNTRVKVLVPESFDIGDSVVSVEPLSNMGNTGANAGSDNSNQSTSANLNSIFTLSTADMESSSEIETIPGFAAGTVTTIAANIGTAIYMIGLQKGFIATVKVPGISSIRVNTPLVGIMQEGEGLFKDLTETGSLSSTPNRVSRLTTLIHEAAHSNGNSRKKSLGFPHAKCPSSHAYAGHYCCDNSSNGPYTIGAQFMSAFAKSCSNCKTSEVQVLKTVAADYFSRSLSDTVLDQTPEPAR